MTPSVKMEHPVPQHITADLQTQEQAWAQAAQGGDQAAFMFLVDAYQRPVYNLCHRMLGDPVEAEDAAQETFLRAFTKIKTYQRHRKFSSWLFSIASHYCIDRLRQRRYQLISFDDLPPWRWLPDSKPEPETVALTREAQDRVHILLDALPPDYRAAIILRYWHEMSYDEIAETLDSSVSAIKSRLFRAKQMMSKELEMQETATPT